MYDSDGVKVRHLFGTWHEAIFCGEDPDSAQCVWRTGKIFTYYHTCTLANNIDVTHTHTHAPCISAPMPEDYEQYFSFGQFAIELNELEEGLKDKLPQTDCRFRPDQR